MAESVTISPLEAVADLGARLALYHKASGKTATAILAQKGAQLVYGNSDARFGATFPGLQQLFQRQTPRPGRITTAANIRGWRLGRKNFGSPHAGLSATAVQRAQFWMEGHKTILATPRIEDGRISLGAIRVGKRGRRVLGGRKGRGGSAVSGEFDGPLAQGEKRLNFRAVATVMEVRLREASRNYLGAVWLFRRWRRLAATDPRRIELGAFRFLANVNPRAKLQLQAEAELRGDAESGNATLRLTTFAPGVKELGDSRGLYAQALAAVSADIETYLARKLGDAADNILSAA